MHSTQHPKMDGSGYMRVREKLIAAQADWYWFMRGCPAGSREAYWLRAELEIDLEFLGQMNLGTPS